MPHHCFHSLQIAYRTAGDRFPGKLSELFLVLSDDHSAEASSAPENVGFQTSGRGQKHQLEDDQMSTGSNSKRRDLAKSAEKNQSKTQSKNQSRNKPKASK